VPVDMSWTDHSSEQPHIWQAGKVTSWRS